MCNLKGQNVSFKINQFEQDILKGLPYLQRLIYVFALRPYMDYATGVVGIKRGISHQSISEELYIEPHPGYNSGSPSKDQIRRALKGLEKVGAIKILSTTKKLIVHCILADKDNYVENKAATKAHSQADSQNYSISPRNKEYLANSTKKATTFAIGKAATPPVSGNINTLSQQKSAVTVISENFQPSTKIIEKAKQHDCPTATCRDEVIKFISFHQSKGTKRCDWNAEFLGWLLRAKQYQQERQHVSYTNSAKRRPTSHQNLSAVDRVFSANQSLIEATGYVIDHHG